MALRWPSIVCRTTRSMWSTSLPRNCSQAVASNSGCVIILIWATPVTVKGTPSDVSTFSQTGFSVITSREMLEQQGSKLTLNGIPPQNCPRLQFKPYGKSKVMPQNGNITCSKCGLPTTSITTMNFSHLVLNFYCNWDCGTVVILSPITF